MSDLRQAYASTALAGLGWDENMEKAIDRVAAAGRATAFGVSLWRAKYQLESTAYREVVAEALAMFRKRYSADPDELSAALVDQALREYLVPSCRACSGSGETSSRDLRVVCPTCSGSKVHNFTDMERCESMRISYAMAKHAAFKIVWLLGVLEHEDRIMNREMNLQLERIILDTGQEMA